jgi:hypothetical protein
MIKSAKTVQLNAFLLKKVAGETERDIAGFIQLF